MMRLDAKEKRELDEPRAGNTWILYQATPKIAPNEKQDVEVLMFTCDFLRLGF